ncbi:ketoacyl-ACP synthase III [Clostridium sp. NSJ-6]|uniref:Beta-ketoacyl-[acyl-carrier-protein] synthase III n=1 Tax=Clostridium hominis TaxID=2763036 RepID=A0ABR7DBJ4_9CLOT|nr:beta-ketoacyl-ACP synthase III [Clostridium hominis]MBC5628505.1 ketoacyl-ACP synthase III [Clostridium hominis]MDU2671027.1 beta-ketoacyl-ACP synthase III [Clostridium sp.]
MKGVKIVGIGHYCPSNVVSNEYISSLVDTSDEWIAKRTGIKERRISDGESTVDLAVKASEEALKNSGYTTEDIDLIIVATTSPDRIMPSTACSVQERLGCINATAFDISAACSGFVYGLIIANSLLKTNEKFRALVIGAEVLSRIVDWKDRNTCVLFGDGAGAAVLESSDDYGIISTFFGSDGAKGVKALTSTNLSLNNPFVKESDDEKRYIEMEGREVFKFAVSVIPTIVNNLLEKSGEKIDNIKYIIPHQANSRIIDEASRRLGITSDRFYINLERYGNTSSASIPIALDEMIKRELIKKGDKVILAAFGGGLTWAGTLIEI